MLARLRRSNDRMLRGACMFAGMPVRRAVATERHTTCLARPQMHPVAADLHTLRAFAVLRLFNGRDRIEMRAASVGHWSIYVFRYSDTGNR